MAQGHVTAARTAYEAALRLDPNQAAVHSNLALLLDNADQFAAAEDHYRKALTLAPDEAQTWVNFGAMLFQHRHLTDAEAALRKALALNPSEAIAVSALSNLGALLACAQRDDEAEACCRKALAHNPEHRKAAFNLSYLLLKQGRFEEGWPMLEQREWYNLLEARMPCPRWQGEPLPGKSVLITFEAGHGDMIQFCRYATLVKAADAKRIAVLCHPALKALFATLDGCDLAISINENLPDSDFDFWVPPLSLPHHLPQPFGTRIDNIPARLPYLHADPQHIEKFSKPLETNTPKALKIGLVWKGSVNFENDAERSLPSLETLKPLFFTPNVHFFSLQKGQGENEAMAASQGLGAFQGLEGRFTHLGNELNDFADTAAVIAQLDLVMAVDTAVAHLAGALNKPCWLLLPWYMADWRWFKERSDSPWYPGAMRIFRQATMSDWEPVIAQVAKALKELSRP